MFGLSAEKLLLLGLLAVLILGPDKLPQYAQQLAKWVKAARRFVVSTQSQLKSELGEDVDLDWRKLDPRKYDPRRIVREALSEPLESSTPSFRPLPPKPLAPGERPPFDSEAT